MSEDWVDEVIKKIQAYYGLRCRVCGAEMKHAASGPEGTFWACGSPEADFIKIGYQNTEAYNKSTDHYRESRTRINHDAQRAAKHIISILETKKRTDNTEESVTK